MEEADRKEADCPDDPMERTSADEGREAKAARLAPGPDWPIDTSLTSPGATVHVLKPGKHQHALGHVVSKGHGYLQARAPAHAARARCWRGADGAHAACACAAGAHAAGAYAAVRACCRARARWLSPCSCPDCTRLLRACKRVHGIQSSIAAGI
jgi:hypothetical protein